MTHKEKEADFGYTIIVTGRHIQVTQAMKDYAIERLSRIERIGNHITDVQIIMDIQKLDHYVDILMKYNHTTIRSRGATHDMYTSIDVAVEKIARQLRRYKPRLQDYHAKSSPIVNIPVKVVSSSNETDEINDQIEEETERRQANGTEDLFPYIISHETQQLKTLTEAEAVMKMDLSDEAAMIFRCEEDNRLKVIFRREKGVYGIIVVQDSNKK